MIQFVSVVVVSSLVIVPAELLRRIFTVPKNIALEKNVHDWIDQETLISQLKLDESSKLVE